MIIIDDDDDADDNSEIKIVLIIMPCACVCLLITEFTHLSVVIWHPYIHSSIHSSWWWWSSSFDFLYCFHFHFNFFFFIIKWNEEENEKKIQTYHCYRMLIMMMMWWAADALYNDDNVMIMLEMDQQKNKIWYRIKAIILKPVDVMITMMMVRCILGQKKWRKKEYLLPRFWSDVSIDDANDDGNESIMTVRLVLLYTVVVVARPIIIIILNECVCMCLCVFIINFR